MVADNCYFADSKKDAEVGGYSAPSGGVYDSTLDYANQLSQKRDSFDYPYPAKVDADDFAVLDDDDGQLPF